MTVEEWNTNFIRCMGMLLNGQIMKGIDAEGNYTNDDILLLLVNAFWEKITFTLPNDELGKNWEVLLDTSKNETSVKTEIITEKYDIPGRSLILLRCVNY